jgi:hypothetical protein
MRLVDRDSRDQLGEQIVAGYRAHPQDERELGWADEASVRMITSEPW